MLPMVQDPTMLRWYTTVMLKSWKQILNGDMLSSYQEWKQ